MTTDTEIRAMLAEAHRLDAGVARNAQCERAFAAARSLGDVELVAITGMELIRAYEFSAEMHKMLVPFAHLLKLLDEGHEALRDRSYNLLWTFKWAASALRIRPSVPLAASRDWTAQMRRRYAEAGYSDNAVLKAELGIARHIGDLDAADELFEKWRASARDGMSDCHACDENAAGTHHAERGRDEQALVEWAPVLDGRRSCAEEPERVLAQSLLPLMRLGRVDEARNHHLRGYRMVAGRESLRETVGEHIEFCALTGNEARGLRVLLDHADWIGGEPDVDVDRHFLAGVLVLLDRLAVLGEGGREIPGPKSRQWTVDDLREWLRAELVASAARFDARNGTPAVGERLRARLDREPFDVVALGYSRRIGDRRPDSPPQPAPVTADLDDLVAEAWDREWSAHPHARHSWRAVAARAVAADVELDPAVRAILDRDDALDEPGADREGVRLRASTTFAAIGRDDLAVMEGAVVAVERAWGGDLDAAAEILAGLPATTEPRAAFMAASTAAALDALRAADLDTADSILRTLVDGGDTPEATVRRMVAETLRARVAVSHGDLDRALARLDDVLDAALALDRPWRVASTLLVTTQIRAALGDPEGAVRDARDGLAQPVLDDEVAARLRLTLARLHWSLDEKDDALRQALTAVDLFDRVAKPEARDEQRWAHALVGEAHLEADMVDAGITFLDIALDGATETDLIVHTRALLADAFLRTHRSGDAAVHLAELARLTEDDPGGNAMIVSRLADALGRAGRTDEALTVFARARRLWTELDADVPLLRVDRSTAVIEHGGRVEGVDVFEERMTEIVERARRLVDASNGDETDGPFVDALRAEIFATLFALADGIDDAVLEFDLDDPDDAEEADRVADLTDRSTRYAVAASEAAREAGDLEGVVRASHLAVGILCRDRIDEAVALAATVLTEDVVGADLEVDARRSLDWMHGLVESHARRADSGSDG